uniref:Secreted protein n=1 Tax=Trichogramma kaykai TaxID=54128 RepID=A0ABD2X1S3_9HYME
MSRGMQKFWRMSLYLAYSSLWAQVGCVSLNEFYCLHLQPMIVWGDALFLLSRIHCAACTIGTSVLLNKRQELAQWSLICATRRDDDDAACSSKIEDRRCRASTHIQRMHRYLTRDKTVLAKSEFRCSYAHKLQRLRRDKQLSSFTAEGRTHVSHTQLVHTRRQDRSEDHTLPLVILFEARIS